MDFLSLWLGPGSLQREEDPSNKKRNETKGIQKERLSARHSESSRKEPRRRAMLNLLVDRTMPQRHSLPTEQEESYTHKTFAMNTKTFNDENTSDAFEMASIFNSHSRVLASVCCLLNVHGSLEDVDFTSFQMNER